MVMAVFSYIYYQSFIAPLNITVADVMEQVSKFDRAWLFSSFQTKKIIESRKTVHNNDDNEKA